MPTSPHPNSKRLSRDLWPSLPISPTLLHSETAKSYIKFRNSNLLSQIQVKKLADIRWDSVWSYWPKQTCLGRWRICTEPTESSHYLVIIYLSNSFWLLAFYGHQKVNPALILFHSTGLQSTYSMLTLSISCQHTDDVLFEKWSKSYNTFLLTHASKKEIKIHEWKQIISDMCMCAYIHI